MLKQEIKERKSLFILILFFIGVNALSILIAKGLTNSGNFLGATQAIILFSTGVVLLWYTWETWRLRQEAQKQVEEARRQTQEIQGQIEVSQRQVEIAKRQVEETQRQTEIEQRPFVIVQEIKDNRILLRNIGTSSAINIKICGIRADIVPFLSQDINLTYYSLRSISSISYMGHTFIEPTSVKVDISTKDGNSLDDNLISENCFFMFKIVYDNVEMLTYYTEQFVKANRNEIENLVDFPHSIELKIFSSGKLDNRTDEEFIHVYPSEDGKMTKFCLTETGKRRLREIIQ